MITRRTKVQLLVFAIITLVGVSYVGARYAQLDRLVVDDSYTVVAHFDDAGGIFSGAEVTYRGVGIGDVERLVLTQEGVDAYLRIEDSNDEIPVDSMAVVGNRSAVGEQYVELQPRTDDGPFLDDGSEIAREDTSLPISTTTLLTNLSNTVSSVDQESLRTTIFELGTAFEGTGRALQQIIDTGNSFIETANDNFDITTDLLEDSNVVLERQVASAGALRTFAEDLSLFTGTLRGSDRDLRRLIDEGGASVTEVRTFLEENEVSLNGLLNNLITTGEIVVERLPGIRQLLVLYPYVVEGGYTVVDKNPEGLYDAHFGLVLTEAPLCTRGYESTDRRTPENREDRPMNEDARCTEPASVTNARGAQNAPNRAPTGFDQAPVIGSYDRSTGSFTWGDTEGSDAATGTVAPPSLRKESWKWLFLQPMTTGGR
ncbi:MlaD family protein [Nocardioides sp. SOB77]|uniref:MlaD family protein n=1 Tax=Nocardioides oceani TaxID=3058369 RepID=A0ABT8FAE2_9ACTN|nr:MlaD family protein [Nocardioides oceani]MDN4171648.1 MlaD family protein [Nocardioides oceani]